MTATPFLAALVLLAGCASVPGGYDRNEVLRRILPSTVQLRAERSDGVRRAASGVVVAADRASNRSWILTTHHFLEGSHPQRFSVVVPGRRNRMVATITAASRDLDLALVEVAGLLLPPVVLTETVRLADEVYVVSFPFGRRLTIAGGIVSQVTPVDGHPPVEGALHMVDASVSYGSSGGGVFEAATGALIGIVEGYRTARVTLGENPERHVDLPVPGGTTVVPASVIRRFLGEQELPPGER